MYSQDFFPFQSFFRDFFLVKKSEGKKGKEERWNGGERRRANEDKRRRQMSYICTWICHTHICAYAYVHI